jgi:hypothetical protein
MCGERRKVGWSVVGERVDKITRWIVWSTEYALVMELVLWV